MQLSHLIYSMTSTEIRIPQSESYGKIHKKQSRQWVDFALKQMTAKQIVNNDYNQKG